MGMIWLPLRFGEIAENYVAQILMDELVGFHLKKCLFWCQKLTWLVRRVIQVAKPNQIYIQNKFTLQSFD